MKRGTKPSAAVLVAALAERLREAAKHLLEEDPDGATSDDAAERAAALLPSLVDVARKPEATAQRWLLFVAIHGRYPDTAEFLRLSRAMELDAPEVSTVALLDSAVTAPGPYADRGMQVVTGMPVVEVQSSGAVDFVTGIQRTVRETLRYWSSKHPLAVAVWHRDSCALRSPRPEELARLQVASAHHAQRPGVTGDGPTLVVPYLTDVLFLDAPDGSKSDGWACMARFSGNRVDHFAHDLIPITSADLRVQGEAADSTALLSVIKHSHKIACNSATTEREIQGYVQGLAAQGLRGPLVRAVPLPTVGAMSDTPRHTSPGRPSGRVVIVCPGTRERHKNHETILWAAERLWREGLNFELRFVGRMGAEFASFREVEQRLVAKGRPITDLGMVSDDVMWSELGAADAAAFISLQEGFGLPIVEALSVGTPVMTTSYGSQGELGRLGGCLLVDPRDDSSVTAGLRRLVTEPALRADLRAQISQRPQRTWEDFAVELWDFLIGDENGGER
ncbi:glycosyltransferase [Catellatospora paridis]|uniref:glycosyltransferase n=1 Tax=Catellatospora paridis TaxID=1617086 RepID=UPI0012D4A648|nr:glycosyltransferase [Catellatospora paridis]